LHLSQEFSVRCLKSGGTRRLFVLIFEAGEKPETVVFI
jgi:hypothetical protein